LFDATFNNISVISWRSVLLVEETGVPGENLLKLNNSFLGKKQSMIYQTYLDHFRKWKYHKYNQTLIVRLLIHTLQIYQVSTTWLLLIIDWLIVVRNSSVVRRHYIFLLEPWDVRELYIRKTADLLLQLWVSTFPRFVAIRFYFLSETLI
jgi:hypothetical protein